MKSLPHQAVQVVTQNGQMTEEYRRYFDPSTVQPGKAGTVTPTGSPFKFTAPSTGRVVIAGGAVSAIQYSRLDARTNTSTTANIGQTAGIVPMLKGDSVIVTYSAAPTNFVFFPD